jgi:hypothetical protein
MVEELQTFFKLDTTSCEWTTLSDRVTSRRTPAVEIRRGFVDHDLSKRGQEKQKFLPLLVTESWSLAVTLHVSNLKTLSKFAVRHLSRKQRTLYILEHPL